MTTVTNVERKIQIEIILKRELVAHDSLIPRDPWVLEEDKTEHYITGLNNSMVHSVQDENSHGCGE